MMRLAVAMMLALAAAFALACSDDDPAYRADLGDDAYPLREMLPVAEALPFAMDSCPLAPEPTAVPGELLDVQACTGEFDNAMWASLFDTEDVDAKQLQLDSLGRVNNALALLTWQAPFAHLGEASTLTLQSTLYEEVADAEEALVGLCGLPLDDSLVVSREEFWLDTFADGTSGFMLAQEIENFGTVVDTVVCFRTGRLVHAIDVNRFGDRGNIAEAIDLALVYRDAVDAVFEDL